MWMPTSTQIVYANLEFDSKNKSAQAMMDGMSGALGILKD